MIPVGWRKKMRTSIEVRDLDGSSRMIEVDDNATFGSLLEVGGIRASEHKLVAYDEEANECVVSPNDRVNGYKTLQLVGKVKGG